MNALKALTELYYHVKPFVPRYLQIALRRRLVSRKRLSCADIWPIDEKAGKPPDEWPGWPDGKRFALILTHDVETERGQEKCRKLMELEKEQGFVSCFNFVPERYSVSTELRRYLTDNGFEVGVHDLNHDGKLFRSEKTFQRRAVLINRYLKEWNAVGFRSGSMHHNLEWIHDLDIKYDSSTFDTDPFEPLSDGVGTIFPFHVRSGHGRAGYMELPYSLPQDFTLFVIMQEKTIDIWKRKLDWIAEQGGMALLITHPDYMNFNEKKQGVEEYPAGYYKEFLKYIRDTYSGRYWDVLPREMAHFWAKNIARVE